MSVGSKSNTLEAVAEKLRQLTDDIQEQYEAFVDATQLYKKGKVNQQDFMPKLADYLIRSTSLNVGAIEVLFELKHAVDKNISKIPGQPHQKPTDSPSLSAATSNSAKLANVKTCISCESTIPIRAKFCNKCGKSQ